MRPRRHLRQVLLFLVAILLPCALLIVLSIRMLRQDRELGEKRFAEEQRREVDVVGQKLLVILEQIKLQEVGAVVVRPERIRQRNYENNAVVLVAWVRNNRLQLPWDTRQIRNSSRASAGQGDFLRRIREGERAEVVEKNWSNATELYQQARQAARSPMDASFARLALARTHLKMGQRDAAQAHYLAILRQPSDVADEHGVPVALYAAGRLLDIGGNQRAVLERLRAEIDSNRWMAPSEAHMLAELTRSLAEKGSGADLREKIRELLEKCQELIRRVEQVLALRNDFPNLFPPPAGGALAPGRLPVWIPYGEEAWLVSLAPILSSHEPAVVAVRGRAAFASLSQSHAGAGNGRRSDKVQFLTGADARGDALGPNFPGLTAVFPPRQESGVTEQWNLQRRFYLVSLLLVLSVTFFGAYLLWRDVRRELQMADLRSQFVSSVSHEFKTPLTSIRMFAETLRLGRSADAGTQAEYLETIVNESERLTRLLNNVLDFSKIEQGKKTYHAEPTAVPEVIEATVRAMQYALGQQGFRLRVDIQNDLPPVRADRDALEQALLNLLTNAVKYSGKSREIDLRLGRRDGDAVIQVIDRGVGIPKEEQRRIFEEFYRVRTPENLLIPGTGLGLTLVEHMAKAHGWRVEVESTPGQGSTFSLRIPLETKT